MPSDAPAAIHGDRVLHWGEFTRRSNNLAAALVGLGAKPGDKLAIYSRNSTDYVECIAACFKARLVQVNANFRYLDDELHYIFENSDARFVFYGEEFADRVDKLRAELPEIQWIQMGGDPPSFALSHEDLAEMGDGIPLEIERSPDDLLFIYTGGTTGMPKAVMWRAADLWGALGFGRSNACNLGEAPETPEAHVENLRRFGPGAKQIVVCPLMHGTGLFTAISNLISGGCVITLPSHNLDIEELWNTVERIEVDSLVIVGDAFARPMLAALDLEPDRWNLSSIKMIISSGVMWSRDIKMGLLAHHSGMLLADMFGSSEAVGFGSSVTKAGGESKTAKFSIGDSCKVFNEQHEEVAPGSGERGFIARSGPIPLGYYKDEKKTAETFPTIDGVRYSIPGDWCTVEADGTLNLLGRGSACINTAGEKVYPEEIEEALKTHDDIEDALVFGIADEKWGHAVTAVVQLRTGATFDEAPLRTFIKGQLAHYKTPKRIFPVEAMFRAPNGKADYKRAVAFVEGL